MSFEDIMHELEKINGNSFTTDDVMELQVVLNDLVKGLELYVTKKNKYILLSKMPNFKVGIIDVKEKGFGFLLSDTPGEKDIHIEKELINGALDGDKVLVEILGSNPNKPEGKVLKIIERDKKNIVGEIKVIKSRKVFVTDDKKFKNTDIKIDQKELDRCVEGEILAVSIDNDLSRPNNFIGKIKARIGHKDDPGMDIIELAAKYDVFEPFPPAAMEEAESLPTEVLEEERYGRKDYTDKMIFTIDGKDTKDIDDAISIDILPNGNYLLGVHIADVSHYVTENSALDKEALVRATSNYPGDKVIPQLPHILSNGICSLNEGVDRLAVTCEMEINHQGRVVSSEVFPSVIRSNKKMNYTDCNAILEGTVAEGYEPFVETLLKMKELHEIIRKEREGRGATDFDTVEPKFVFDENHHVIDVIARERGVFEKVIEDFMIVANESVAREFENDDRYMGGLPSIYRVHAAPLEEKVQQFITYCNVSGHPITGKFKNVENPQLFKKILDQIEANDEEKEIIMRMAIRTMAKAVYSKENIGHFGLASPCYTHFTSPIRRYPDLQVHRLLRTYFFDMLDPHMLDNAVKYWDAHLDEIAKQSSDRERNADELERAADDMFMADYMEDHIGDEYDAIVSGIQSFGLFVQLPNRVEGLLKLENMPNDIYVYDEATNTMMGKNSKKTYRIGSFIHVKCIGASKALMQVDFEQVNPEQKQEETQEKTR
jgi:ribonuclease R